MARTKLMRKQEYYQRKKEYQAAAQRSIGNKNIFNCIIRNRQIKIKKFFLNSGTLKSSIATRWSEEWNGWRTIYRSEGRRAEY